MITTAKISVKGKWVSVPALEVNGRTLVCTGEWVKIAAIKDEYWQERACEDPQAYIEALKLSRSQGFNADIFTFSQKLPDVTPQHAYPVQWDNVAAIRLSTYENWWNKLSTETRRNVRLSAKRAVTTRIVALDDELINGIVSINNESELRQGRRFPHHGKDFDAVKKDYSSFDDRSLYIGAYCNGELIAFVKIVYMGEVAAIMQLLSKMAHYDKKPANALVAKAVEYCCSQNHLSFLTYIRFHYGNKRESPLTEFKRRNGFEEIAVPTYCVPLTFKGKMVMALNLHRPLVDILPERLIYALLAVRSRWQQISIRATGPAR